MCDTSTLISTTQSDLHSCWIIYTKGDGKEHLTVTDAKPLFPANSTIMSSNAITKAMDDTDLNLNDDEDNDVTDQSLAELLDPELQPEKPIPNNPESQQIYREHRRLAKEYLRVDTKLCYAQALKEATMSQMNPVERQQKKELLRKMSERDELLELYNNLKQQMLKIQAGQIETANPNNANATLEHQTSQQEIVADDGWVMIARDQNT